MNNAKLHFTVIHIFSLEVLNMPELWLSIVPALSAIVFAMWTKQVIPSLLVGLWIGSMLYTGSFIDAFNQTITYVMGVLTDTGNLDVLLFLYLFRGLVALIHILVDFHAFEFVFSDYIKGPNKKLLSS